MKRCPKCSNLVSRDSNDCQCGYTFFGGESELLVGRAGQPEEPTDAIQKADRAFGLKYVIIAILCGIISIGIVFSMLISNGPNGGFGYGYGKMIAYMWPYFSLVVFGLLWPVALFSDFFIRLLRRKLRGSIMLELVVVLLFGGLPFSWSAHLVYPIVAKRMEDRRLVNKARTPEIDQVWASSFAADFLAKSRNGDGWGVLGAEAFGVLLRNPSISVETIEAVAQKLDGDSGYWQCIAENPLVSEKVAKYADEKQGSAPRCFVQGIKPRPEYLKLFSNSPNEQVRKWIAMNKSTPPEVLEKLSTDKACRLEIARNPSTSEHVLERLYLESRNAGRGDAIREDIAKNPSTPTHILEAMVKDEPYSSPSLKAKDKLKQRTINSNQK